MDFSTALTKISTEFYEHDRAISTYDFVAQ